MVRFRQFCDAREAFGLGKGENFNWNVFSDVVTPGGSLNETDEMPATNFTITQNSLTITEYGNSVPFTKKLDDLSEQPVTEIIHKVLKNDARKVLDSAAYAQFQLTLLRVTPTAGNSLTTLDLNQAGTAPGTNNVEFRASHAKLIADLLAERDVPTFDGVNYMAVARPTTLRTLKNDLESIHQYTSEGWHVIMNGEKGRYEGIRFIEQTNIASLAWTNAKSDQIYFFGSDTVVEAFAIPEEVRGKIPTDFGRSRGIAWYAELGYGIVHDTAAQSRIIKWDSLA
jgi:N4-gp56 family major capsid protein